MFVCLSLLSNRLFTMESDIRILFIHSIEQHIKQNEFIKLSLGNYKGTDPDLKNIYVKPVQIKKQLNLSFTYRYKTRDITKNYTVQEALRLIGDLFNAHNFAASTLFITQANITCQQSKNKSWATTSSEPTAKMPTTLTHDHQKERKLAQGSKNYLHRLKLTDEMGNVYKNAQDKWKQINHYIELLSTMLKELPAGDVLQVVDMGSGKGYLTFALYDYLVNVLGKPSSIVGVEYRKDMVELCNRIAKMSSFANLRFEEGSIDEYRPKIRLDVLIALHACDTATDDAIAKGIENNAHLIVVAPCCHKQIRREMEKSKVDNRLDFLLKHGIFLERQAEMVTDGLRALILEYYGYQTKIFEFVSDAHTPKNVLVVGVKKSVTQKRKDEILIKIKATKEFFGIGYHHLERLVGLEV